MSDNVRIFSFPDTETDALAYLYTKNQDLSGKSVKEIAEIYYNAYYELKSYKADIRKKASSKYHKPIYG